MIASYLDSTNLKNNATYEDIIKLCEEAKTYKMAAVCVLPYRVGLAQKLLDNSGVKICTVVGFPLGADHLTTKVLSAKQALNDGANEIDVVINILAVKDGDFEVVEKELKAILDLKKEYDFELKAIVETALLTENELINLVKIINNVNCDYIKTSTGFSTRGVSIEDIQIINAHKSNDLKIKASGGIRTWEFARELIELGVDRIGTSSAVQIIEEMQKGEDY